MRIVLLLLLLGLAAPAAAAAPAERPRTVTVKMEAPCPYDLAMRHARKQGAARPERLAELPPGDLFHAVAREVDGCLEPVVVRQNIGGVRRP